LSYIYKIFINVNIAVQYPSFLQLSVLTKHVRVAENQRHSEIKHILS